MYNFRTGGAYLPNYAQQKTVSIPPGFGGMGGMMRDYSTPVQQVSAPTAEQPSAQQILPLNVSAQSGGDGNTTLGSAPKMGAHERTAAEQFAGLESLAGQRAQDSLLSSAFSGVKKNLGKVVAGGLMGADVNVLDALNPASMLTAPTKAMYAGMGIEAPKNFGGFLTSKIPSVVAALTGVGLPLSIAAGLMGTPLADAFGDVTGWRDNDEARDKLEDASGELRGRSQYADAMQRDNVTDTSLLEGGSFYDAAQMAKTRSQATPTNVDAVQAALNQYNAFNTLSNIQSYGDVESLIGSGYGNTTTASIDQDLGRFFNPLQASIDKAEAERVAAEKAEAARVAEATRVAAEKAALQRALQSTTKSSGSYGSNYGGNIGGRSQSTGSRNSSAGLGGSGGRDSASTGAGAGGYGSGSHGL